MKDLLIIQQIKKLFMIILIESHEYLLRMKPDGTINTYSELLPQLNNKINVIVNESNSKLRSDPRNAKENDSFIIVSNIIDTGDWSVRAKIQPKQLTCNVLESSPFEKSKPHFIDNTQHKNTGRARLYAYTPSQTSQNSLANTHWSLIQDTEDNTKYYIKVSKMWNSGRDFIDQDYRISYYIDQKRDGASGWYTISSEPKYWCKFNLISEEGKNNSFRIYNTGTSEGNGVGHLLGHRGRSVDDDYINNDTAWVSGFTGKMFTQVFNFYHIDITENINFSINTKNITDTTKISDTKYDDLAAALNDCTNDCRYIIGNDNLGYYNHNKQGVSKYAQDPNGPYHIYDRYCGNISDLSNNASEWLNNDIDSSKYPLNSILSMGSNYTPSITVTNNTSETFTNMFSNESSGSNLPGFKNKVYLDYQTIENYIKDAINENPYITKFAEQLKSYRPLIFNNIDNNLNNNDKEFLNMLIEFDKNFT